MDGWLASLDEPFEGAPFRGPRRGAAGWRGAVGRQLDARARPRRLAACDRPGDRRPLEPRRERDRRRRVDGAGVRGGRRGPVALVVGDVSFLHDLNALVISKLHGLSATIVLVNNDGGGIFSFLPQAQPGVPAGSGLPEHYEELFGTPHGIDVAPIVTALAASTGA